MLALHVPGAWQDAGLQHGKWFTDLDETKAADVPPFLEGLCLVKTNVFGKNHHSVGDGIFDLTLYPKRIAACSPDQIPTIKLWVKASCSSQVALNQSPVVDET